MPCIAANCIRRQFIIAMSLAPSLVGCTNPVSISESSQSKKPVPVKAVSVVQEELQQTSVQPATVHAFFRTEIRARTTGYVKSVNVDIGDVVKQGATLAVIDVPEMEKRKAILESRVLQYRAKQRQAEAGVTVAKANVVSVEAKRNQAESELNKAEAILAATEIEFKRTKDLVDRMSIEPRLLDEVRKKRDSAIANRESVAAAINSAKADVKVAQANLASADADLEAAKAETNVSQRELEELIVLMDYAVLKAPFDGVVTLRSVDQGELVRESNEVGEGKPLFAVSQVDKVRVHVALPESDAALVSNGDTVSLRFPSFPGEKEMQANVTRVAGELDPYTRTMLVEAVIENGKGKLLPGMFGEASITFSNKVAANTLPARAVRFRENGEAYVYVIAEDETVTVTPVKTGLDNGHTIEVTEGVSAGQRVIDAHLKRFVDGQQVVLLDP